MRGIENDFVHPAEGGIGLKGALSAKHDKEGGHSFL